MKLKVKYWNKRDIYFLFTIKSAIQIFEDEGEMNIHWVRI